MEKSIASNPAIIKYMIDNGIGWIKETTPDIMKKTGATGKHIHFGKDQLAIKTRDEMIAKYNPNYISKSQEGSTIQFKSTENATITDPEFIQAKQIEKKDVSKTETSPKSSNWFVDMYNSFNEDNEETQTSSSTTSS